MRESAAIVTVDSGLGGMGITAELVEQLKARKATRRAEVIFFNCRPTASMGYDAMPSDEMRYRVLSNALEAVAQREAPDFILLACNTLSAIYGRTDFARRKPVPVLGIIEVGADLIMERWRQLIEAQVVLFAAPTTIRSGAYSRALTDRGLPADRLTSQIGGELIGLIERSAQGKEARTCVRRIVGEALDRVPDRSRPVIASLNCTHFTFVADQFKEAFRERGITPAALVAPDSQMVERFVRDLGEGSYETCDVTARVISQVAIGAQERDCIGRLIRWRSPQTAQALETYQLIPDLFRTAGVRSSR